MKQLSSPIDLIKKSCQIFFKKENFIYFIKIYAVLLIFYTFILFRKPAVDIIFWITMLATVFFHISGLEAIRRVIGGEKLLVKSAFLVGFRKYFKFSF